MHDRSTERQMEILLKFINCPASQPADEHDTLDHMKMSGDGQMNANIQELYHHSTALNKRF